MKHLYIIVIFILTLGSNISYTQGCDPVINGFSFSIANCLDLNTADLTVEWGMSGLDPLCSAPANSFAIQISLPASEVYGVLSIADVTTPSSFDWTLINPYTLEGVNNVAINWLDQGDIVVNISPKLTNGCTLLESNSNIVIFGSGPPFFGSPSSFNDDPTNNSSSDDLGVADVTLPVGLESFEAKNVDCYHNELSWTTGTEINNSGFEIQRSTDAITFEQIGFVESSVKTTNGIREYLFVDKELNRQRNFYYRLKQINLDGGYEIFHTKSVTATCDENIDVLLYPNPARNELNFNVNNYSGTSLDLSIHSINGKLLKRINHRSGNGVIDISYLDAGLYLLKISTTTESIEKNFIKIN